jgi:FAD/FMN-containing dehydrogenase
VPGTKQVSLGGAVAADIHGKNHHRVGSFGNHVIELELLTAGGDLLTCSPNCRAELFWATVGGMGLTGIITRVTVRLIANETEYMVVKHAPTKNLDEALELSESSDYDDEYSVVWLDCVARRRTLGRGVFISGHHAKLDELPAKFRSRHSSSPKMRRLRFDFPRWLLNQFTVGLFDDLYYWRQGRRRSAFISDYDSFFFPLDRIGDWNRMYGSPGFIQYQSVLPTQTAVSGLNEMLAHMLKHRRSSYLTVLKRFGPENKGLLSFPTAGYTLTFDFPVERDLFPFLDELDRIVLEHGGRVYLAKDARMSREVFAQMYPGLGEWLRLKSEIDPHNKFSSDLSRRLGLSSFT